MCKSYLGQPEECDSCKIVCLAQWVAPQEGTCHPVALRCTEGQLRCLDGAGECLEQPESFNSAAYQDMSLGVALQPSQHRAVNPLGLLRPPRLERVGEAMEQHPPQSLPLALALPCQHGLCDLHAQRR